MSIVRTLCWSGDSDGDNDDDEKEEMIIKILLFGGNDHKMSLHLEWQTSGMACHRLNLVLGWTFFLVDT